MPAALLGALLLLLLVSLPLRGAATEPRPFGIIDLHVDLPYQTVFKGRSFQQGTGQYDARALRRAGVVGVVLPMYVPNDASTRGPLMEHLEKSYRELLSVLPKTPPYTTPGCGPSEGVRTWLAFEGAAPLGRDLESIWEWSRRGVRFYGLVHVHDNVLATSAGGSPQFRSPKRGLTDVGFELVRRIHATGGVVDVSHASDAAIADVIRAATFDAVPVVATHSNARALMPHPRNLSDEQVRQIASTGGVIGVNFHSRFLVPSDRQAKLSDVVAHIRHLVRVGGVDHVAIGSDFEGGITPPPELKTVEGFPRLAQALLDSGLTQSDVEKIFGKNALRILCQRRPRHCM